VRNLVILSIIFVIVLIGFYLLAVQDHAHDLPLPKFIDRLTKQSVRRVTEPEK
jgi:hypothetical protein